MVKENDPTLIHFDFARRLSLLGGNCNMTLSPIVLTRSCAVHHFLSLLRPFTHGHTHTLHVRALACERVCDSSVRVFCLLKTIATFIVKSRFYLGCYIPTENTVKILLGVHSSV